MGTKVTKKKGTCAEYIPFLMLKNHNPTSYVTNPFQYGALFRDDNTPPFQYGALLRRNNTPPFQYWVLVRRNNTPHFNIWPFCTVTTHPHFHFFDLPPHTFFQK